jgi:hypothetical protein
MNHQWARQAVAELRGVSARQSLAMKTRARSDLYHSSTGSQLHPISDEEVRCLMQEREEGNLTGWTMTPDEEWLEH